MKAQILPCLVADDLFPNYLVEIKGFKRNGVENYNHM
jgi:hypothetical protein